MERSPKWKGEVPRRISVVASDSFRTARGASGKTWEGAPGKGFSPHCKGSCGNKVENINGGGNGDPEARGGGGPVSTLRIEYPGRNSSISRPNGLGVGAARLRPHQGPRGTGARSNVEESDQSTVRRKALL